MTPSNSESESPEQRLKLECTQDATLGSHRFIVTVTNVGDAPFSIDRNGVLGFTYLYLDSNGREIKLSNSEPPERFKKLGAALRNSKARFKRLQSGESLQIVVDPMEGNAVFIVGTSEGGGVVRVSAYEQWMKVDDNAHIKEVRVKYECAPKPEGFHQYFGTELEVLGIVDAVTDCRLVIASD